MTPWGLYLRSLQSTYSLKVFSSSPLSFLPCRDLGYSDDDLDKVIEKLLSHLRNDDPVVRANAAWTLGELGVNRKAVLMGLVPASADSDVSMEK